MCLQQLQKAADALPLFLEASRRASSLLMPTDPWSMKLAYNVGACHAILDELELAISVLQQTFALQQASLGLSHPDTLASLEVLAACYTKTKQSDQAQKLYDTAISISQRKFGTVNPITTRFRIKLAHEYRIQGRTSDALAIFGHTLRTAFSPREGCDDERLETMLAAAGCEFTLGSIQEARELAEKAFNLLRVVRPVNELLELAALGILGQCELATGDPKRALNMLTDVLRRRQDLLEPNHPDILMAMGDVGNAYLALGNPREALKYLADAYEKKLNVLGENDPLTLNAVDGLATCFMELGEGSKALSLYETASQRARSNLGPKHSCSLQLLDGLGSCLEQMGEIPRALTVLEDTYNSRCDLLGPNNFFTLATLSKVAACYGKIGETEKSIKLFESAVSGEKQIRGPDNFEVLRDMNNLALLYKSTGQFPKATRLFEDVLDKRRRLFGEDHIDTITSLACLAGTLNRSGQSERALELYLQILQKRKSMQGESHVNVIETLSNLQVTYMKLRRWREAFDALSLVLDGLSDQNNLGQNWSLMANSAAHAVFELETVGIRTDWSSRFSALSDAFVQMLDLSETHSGDRRRRDFVEMHLTWLMLCLTQDPEQIPTVLSRLQSWEMMALMLAELEAGSASYEHEDIRWRFLELRRRLRVLRLQMKTASLSVFGELEAVSGAAHADYNELLALHRCLLDEMVELRSQLVIAFPDYQLAYKPPNINIKILSQMVREQELLVLLFTMQGNEATFSYDGNLVHAFCFDSRGRCQVVPLPKFNHIGPLVTDAIGFRRGSRGIVRADPALEYEYDLEGVIWHSDEVENFISEHFWKILREKFPDTTRWQIATHQSLHTLPITLGADVDHQVVTYPGLVFYYRQGSDNVFRRNEEGQTVAMHFDAAIPEEDTTSNIEPIPFVRAEAALVRSVWGSRC